MNMKKILILIVVLVVLGVGYWLVSPFWRNTVVSETVPVSKPNTQVGKINSDSVALETMDLFSGSFTGFDKVHTGSGTAKILKIDGKTYLRFEDNFNVNNGPDLYVGFGYNGKYVKGSEISKLKGNIGSQNYELPEGFDETKYNEVWIWCKAFSVPFAKAVF
jgi:uncharacterized protein YxeA